MRSWVGMLSGIQGTGLRGPVTQADEFIKLAMCRYYRNSFLSFPLLPIPPLPFPSLPFPSRRAKKFTTQVYCPTRFLLDGHFVTLNSARLRNKAMTWWPVLHRQFSLRRVVVCFSRWLGEHRSYILSELINFPTLIHPNTNTRIGFVPMDKTPKKIPLFLCVG